MDDLLSEFLTETNESISVLDGELVKLEQNPNDPELLSNIFRLVHTIKGTCGFLGLPRLETLAHASENVLGKIRDGELTVTPTAVTLILESLDGIKSILAVLEATETEPAGSDADLIERLNLLASGEPPRASTAKMTKLPATPKAAAKSERAPKMVLKSAAKSPQPAQGSIPATPAEPDGPAAHEAGSPVRAAEDGKESKESALAAQSIRVN